LSRACAELESTRDG